VLVAAPTGSGKTLAAFLAAIDDLIRQGVEGELPDETFVVYVSPLKALSNDIRRNLEAPLAASAKTWSRSGYPDVEIRTLVRTGDTPQSERAQHAPPAAADRRHDSRVAVRAAGPRSRGARCCRRRER
jgi:ATP-dependent Lhr-like helicase